MACFHPMKGWKDGAGCFTTNRSRSAGLPMTVPCGQCIGCRLERSRQWAVRIMHESQLHDHNWFITLTYAPENLPPLGSLRKTDFQKFMKRLRKALAPQKVRYFHCGEYGENFERPHYHAALFGPALDDRVQHDVRGDHPVWRSPTLERAWPHGFSEIGSLTFESAAYMARYITKKVTGQRAEDHYSVLDPATGELHELEPEYITMSRRPGIGHGWWDRYSKEVYPADEIIARGHAQRPPRYYDNQLAKEDPDLLAEIKRLRREARNYQNETEPRLAVREETSTARLSTYGKRGYENET